MIKKTKKAEAKKITTKRLQTLMEKRLSKAEISEIEDQVMLEANILRLLQR